MSIPKLTTDLSIIQKLSDLPNSTEGLTAEQLKAKFDEAGLEIQRWINEIFIPSITAENIPFPKNEEINAETVEAAILAVRKQITDAASGAIVDGTVTKEKLAAALLERVYGGRAWISLDEPGSMDNPDNDFPVGQIWLRAAFSVTNKDNGNWDVSGCEVSTQDGSYILTGTNTVRTASMQQSISMSAEAGDRIYVLFDTGSVDSEITAFTVNINGSGAQDATNGGVFMEKAAGTSVSVRFEAEWPTTSLANGSTEIRNLTIVNVDEILRTAAYAADMKNWAEFLKGLIPFERADIPDALYIQKNNGVWLPIGFDVLPVSRGGTGLQGIADGELLYGSNGGFAKLEKPENTAFLQFNGGNPVWAAMSAMSEYGYARIATGTYVGTGTSSPIILPVTPKLLIINTPGKITSIGWAEVQSAAVLQQGTSQAQRLGGDSSPSVAGIQLDGNTLTPYVGYYQSAEEERPSAWNGNGVTYPWFAIY